MILHILMILMKIRTFCKIIKNKNSYKIDFESKIRGAAPGQSAVFYKDSICLGGGIIESVSKSI